jgi:hypothetical protein
MKSIPNFPHSRPQGEGSPSMRDLYLICGTAAVALCAYAVLALLE